MQYVSVRSIASKLKQQFKVDMDIHDVVSYCSDALKKMGMIALVRTGYVAKIENFCINLPASVWKVRGVVRLDGVPEPPITIDVQSIYFPPQIIFQFEENNSGDTVPIQYEDNVVPQLKGPYIDFVWDCPVLRFNETDVPVSIVTTAIKTDEEGFPMVPEAAFFGCMYYSLYTYYQPLFLMGQLPPQVMGQVEAWKDANMTEAKSNLMLEGLTNNEMNNLFSIMTSMGRKTFNYPV